jgi:curved DNA-binding protein CbpA
MGKDYYAVLGCTKDAAEKEIKKAYKVALLQTPYTINTKI